MSLEQRLRRAGVSRGAIAKISKDVRAYVKDGATIRDAQLTAVRDHITELEGRRREIEEMVSGREDDA